MWICSNSKLLFGASYLSLCTASPPNSNTLPHTYTQRLEEAALKWQKSTEERKLEGIVRRPGCIISCLTLTSCLKCIYLTDMTQLLSGA